MVFVTYYVDFASVGVVGRRIYIDRIRQNSTSMLRSRTVWHVENATSAW